MNKVKVKALVWDQDGDVDEVSPKNGEVFTLEELQGFVEGKIEVIYLPSGKRMVVNEEGKLQGLAANKLAMELWSREFPIEEYPHNNDQFVVGNVLICTPESLGEGKEEDDSNDVNQANDMVDGNGEMIDMDLINGGE